MIVAGSASFCQAQITANLTSQQEVPPDSDSTTYSTTASASFSLVGTILTTTSGSFFNLFGQPVEISVDDGAPGTAGTVLFDLTDSGSGDYVFPTGGGLYVGAFSGSGSLTTQELTDLNNGDLYVNITTTTQSSPGGEVRGQITVAPEPATMTLMAMGSLAWLAKRRKSAQA